MLLISSTYPDRLLHLRATNIQLQVYKWATYTEMSFSKAQQNYLESHSLVFTQAIQRSFGTGWTSFGAKVLRVWRYRIIQMDLMA